jgi:hypothetical protein
MKRIESGVYQTNDGQYRVERVDSLGEGWSVKEQRYVETTSSVWVITQRPVTPNGEWEELEEFPTKKEAVARLRSRGWL